MSFQPDGSNSSNSFRWFCLTMLVSLCSQSRTSADEQRDSFFENNIRPVLVETCFRCHGDSKVSGMLRVDSRKALLSGGDSGPAIVPEKPDESLLMRAIRRDADISAMPPAKDQALRPDQILAFESWIRKGAHWPVRTQKFERQRHWALQPVHDFEPPVVRDTAWLANKIDNFIRSRQEAAGLNPAPAADKHTIIRRATFDLTGLPPTPGEIDDFEADQSPAAFEHLLERLLASPHYGERWGRHWLDIVRYADTAGETADYPVPSAWRYRNYVIDAFNSDKAYDEFLCEQIAGDVLANQGPPEHYAEKVTATGYLAISRRFGFDSENYHHLTIQDTIDTLGQSVLGLSLGCARCHDHKFDDVSMNDYYALYGIFDSSRYAFPGSEQKPKFRSMVPLLPVNESLPQWREFNRRVNQLANRLELLQRPVPAAVFRSLNDMDGDFELQAPAAGGSNGVLVPPWLYEGQIAVTSAAQSPFKNFYSRGRVGVSIPAGLKTYRIAQSLYPQRSAGHLYVNLDFQVTSDDSRNSGRHEFRIGSYPSTPAVVIQISTNAVFLKSGEQAAQIAQVEPNVWNNLQLRISLDDKSVSGVVGSPGSLTLFDDKPLAGDWSGNIDFCMFAASADNETPLPAIQYDNFGLQETPIPEVSAQVPEDGSGDSVDPAELSRQLQELIGLDSEFEFQTTDSPPVSPWNPGPNSVVRLSQAAQSPYQNVFPAGEIGIHLPNRAEYDGFGLTLPRLRNVQQTERLYACFDFRCRDIAAGGDGSWRYYLGHGAGNSAAVELFFNGHQFFRRSGDAIESVCAIVPGEWYQVQLMLELKDKVYSGTIASRTSCSEFEGSLARGWDGQIDYSFIDSYGHIGGVRPALDVDNYTIRDTVLPGLDAASVDVNDPQYGARRSKAIEIRAQLASIQNDTADTAQELNSLLSDGPFPMAYGMAEGTPHNVRMQLRGEPDQPGQEIQRGLIRALGGLPLPAETRGSGRLELARWMTRSDNPLTARVMVNRIWQYHFGRGLVKTPNDFGVRGLPPTHPELLDHLAKQFVQSGWSVKAMHRLIMLSSTYQQSSDSGNSEPAAGIGIDAGDLYTHFSGRRLSAEEIRDTILAVSGDLDTVPGREHPFPSPVSWGFSQHGPFNAVYDHNKRSIYLMTQRLKRHPFLALFDGADPNASTADRLETTVPTQALFFLNDPFVHARADNWAARLQASNSDEIQQIAQAYREALGRRANSEELLESSTFLAGYRTELARIGQDNIDRRALAAFLRTLMGSNEFLHVD